MFWPAGCLALGGSDLPDGAAHDDAVSTPVTELAEEYVCTSPPTLAPSWSSVAALDSAGSLERLSSLNLQSTGPGSAALDTAPAWIEASKGVGKGASSTGLASRLRAKSAQASCTAARGLLEAGALAIGTAADLGTTEGLEGADAPAGAVAFEAGGAGTVAPRREAGTAWRRLLPAKSRASCSNSVGTRLQWCGTFGPGQLLHSMVWQ